MLPRFPGGRQLRAEIFVFGSDGLDELDGGVAERQALIEVLARLVAEGVLEAAELGPRVVGRQLRRRGGILSGGRRVGGRRVGIGRGRLGRLLGLIRRLRRLGLGFGGRLVSFGHALTEGLRPERTSRVAQQQLGRRLCVIAELADRDRPQRPPLDDEQRSLDLAAVDRGRLAGSKRLGVEVFAELDRCLVRELRLHLQHDLLGPVALEHGGKPPRQHQVTVGRVEAIDEADRLVPPVFEVDRDDRLVGHRAEVVHDLAVVVMVDRVTTASDKPDVLRLRVLRRARRQLHFSGQRKHGPQGLGRRVVIFLRHRDFSRQVLRGSRHPRTGSGRCLLRRSLRHEADPRLRTSRGRGSSRSPAATADRQRQLRSPPSSL